MSRTPEMRRERRVLFPTNAVLREVQAKWYFTDDELWRTPSILDGMSMEEEHTLRSKGVYFIIQVGVVLRLSQFTIYTASVFLHRFFMRFSMKDIPNRPGMHPYPVAATSVFLASKVDENCRKMREFVIACCRVAMKNPHMLVDEQTKDFWKWRDTLLHNEDLMLEALCFDVQLELPYRFLEKFVHYFNIQDKTVRNSAWAFINDSLYTIVYVQFQARTVAAAALYAAARQYNYAIEDDPEGRPWWEHLSLSLAKLRRVCNRMADVYEMIAVPHSKRQYLHLAPHDEEDNDKTRKPGKNGQVRPPSESNGKKRGHDQGQVGPPSDENGTTKRRKLGEQPPSPQSSAPHPLSSSNGTGLESPPLPPAVKAGTVPTPPQSQTSHYPSHSPTQTRPPPPLPSSSTSSYSSSRIPPPPPPPLDPASGSTYQPPPPPPPPGALDTPTHPGPSSQPPLRVEAATAAEVQRRIDSIVQHSSGSREPVAPGSSRRPPYAPRPPPRETYRSPVSERAPHGEQDRTREWGRDSARDRYGSEDSGHEWRARHHWDHRTHHRDRDHREHRDHHERAHWSHQRDREYHDRDDRSRDYHDRHHNCDQDHSDRSLWRGGNHKDSDHYSSNHSRNRDGHSGSRGSGNRPDSGHRYEHEHEHE